MLVWQRGGDEGVGRNETCPPRGSAAAALVVGANRSRRSCDAGCSGREGRELRGAWKALVGHAPRGRWASGCCVKVETAVAFAISIRSCGGVAAGCSVVPAGDDAGKVERRTDGRCAYRVRGAVAAAQASGHQTLTADAVGIVGGVR